MVLSMQIVLLCSTVLSAAVALPQYSSPQPPYNQPSPQPAYNQPSSQPPFNQPSSQPPYNQYQTTPVPILNQNSELNPDGSYRYSFQAGNGIAVEEQGTIKNRGSPDHEANSVQGFYSYPGLDGVQYTVTYTAGEEGFVPQGSHLPTSPPIPAELLRALENLPKDDNEYDERGFPLRPAQGLVGRA